MEDFKAASFEVVLTTKDIYSFLLHQSYSSTMGYITAFIFIGALAMFIMFFDDLDIFTMVVLILIFVVYLIMNPLLLYRAAKKQDRANKINRPMPMKYSISTEKITISQNGQMDHFSWGGVIKVRELSNDFIVYVTKVTAFIWPKEAIGDQLPVVREILKSALPRRKVRLRG